MFQHVMTATTGPRLCLASSRCNRCWSGNSPPDWKTTSRWDIPCQGNSASKKVFGGVDRLVSSCYATFKNIVVIFCIPLAGILPVRKEGIV
jgi:hypothetical protein